MIGIIVKTDNDVEDLEKDWVPAAFDASQLNKAFEDALGYVPSKEKFCHDKNGSLIYFTIDDLAEPRAITFNCTLSGSQTKIIGSITKALGAKVYDSELASFIDAANV